MDHNTACMMPLEDIRCTLTLCPNREAREEAPAGTDHVSQVAEPGSSSSVACLPGSE